MNVQLLTLCLFAFGSLCFLVGNLISIWNMLK